MTFDGPVPMPLEIHPAYLPEPGAGIALALSRERPPTALEVLVPRPMRALWEADRETLETTPVRTRPLTVHRCAGRAVTVGPPAMWVWHAAVDELGRAIAGESRLEWDRLWVPLYPPVGPAAPRWPR